MGSKDYGKFISYLFFGLSIFSLITAVSNTITPANNSVISNQSDSKFYSGRYIVKFKPDVSTNLQDSLIPKVSAKSEQRGWVSINIQNKEDYEKIKKQQNVESLYLEPKRYTYAPDDYYYTNQNHIISGQYDQWDLRKIGLTPTTDPNSVWNTTTGSASTIVAVIDTGITLSNPDIGGGSGSTWTENNLWINQEEIPPAIKTAMDTNTSGDVDSVEMINYFRTNNLDENSDGKIDFADMVSTGSPLLNSQDNNSPTNGYSDDIFGYDFAYGDANVNDVDGHGTHVAGTIAAVTNNNSTVNPGIAGICWYCKIMPLKVINDSGFGYDSDIANAITYAVDNGAKVINMSLGGAGYSQVLDDAIVYAWDHDVLVVSAAGNYGASASDSYPGASQKSLSVGATDVTNAVPSFSNKGQRLDITAPGDNILSTFKVNSTGCLTNSNYQCLSGTSMASPHVAGIAALLYDLHKSDPTPWTARDVRYALLKNTTDIYTAGFDTTSGYGLLNGQDAIAGSAIGTDSTLPTASLNAPAQYFVKGNVTFSGTASDDTEIYLYTISFIRTSDNYIVKQTSGRTPVTNGTLLTVDTTTVPDDTYDIQMTVEDFYGNVNNSNTIQIVVDNTLPTTFTLTTPSNNSYTTNPRPSFAWNASTDFTPLTYNLVSNSSNLTTGLTTTSFTPNSDLTDGVYVWSVNAIDSAGNTRNSGNRTFTLDRVAPASFTTSVNTSSTTPIFTFSTTDALAGINYYQISIDGGSYVSVTSPYTGPSLAQGNHTATVRAFDKAGNFRDSNSNFYIENICTIRKTKADFDCDGTVGISDLSILASNWQKTTTNGDTDGNNLVDISDLSVLASNWLKNV